MITKKRLQGQEEAALTSALNKMRTERDAARLAADELLVFVDHRGGCALIDGPSGSGCTCGLDEVRERVESAITEPRGPR